MLGFDCNFTNDTPLLLRHIFTINIEQSNQVSVYEIDTEFRNKLDLCYRMWQIPLHSFVTGKKYCQLSSMNVTLEINMLFISSNYAVHNTKISWRQAKNCVGNWPTNQQCDSCIPPPSLHLHTSSLAEIFQSLMSSREKRSLLLMNSYTCCMLWQRLKHAVNARYRRGCCVWFVKLFIVSEGEENVWKGF